MPDKLFYRYADPWLHGSDELDLRVYAVAKETKCGWWLYLKFFADQDEKIPDRAFWTWRSKDGHFAFESKKDALDSYIKRKVRHKAILLRTMDTVDRGIAEAYRMKSGKPKPQKFLPASTGLMQRLLEQSKPRPITERQ